MFSSIEVKSNSYDNDMQESFGDILNSIDDNAMSNLVSKEEGGGVEQVVKETTMRSKKKKEGKTKAKKEAEWILAETSDFPSITWSDSVFQYTLRDPDNRGDKRVKLQMCSDNIPMSRCELYLNTKENAQDAEVYNTLLEVMTKLQTRWMDMDNRGIPKTAAALPLWRTNNTDIYTTTTTKSKGGERMRKTAKHQKGHSKAATATKVSTDHKKREKETSIAVAKPKRKEGEVSKK